MKVRLSDYPSFTKTIKKAFIFHDSSGGHEFFWRGRYALLFALEEIPDKYFPEKNRAIFSGMTIN